MKKGFTLVELLAVIILLGLLGLIIYPTVNGVINTNKQKLHNKQIEELIRHADSYATYNMSKLRAYDGARNIVTFTDLYKEGIIQNDKVVDPSNDQELTGCMALTWNEQRQSFDIEYTTNCSTSFSLSGTITGSDASNAKVRLVANNESLYETTTDSSGNYSFNDILPGKYILLASQPYKTKYGQEVEIYEDTTKDMAITLYFGDMNDNNYIDSSDSNFVQDCISKKNATNTMPSTCFDELNGLTEMSYDLDKSGAISATDLNVIRSAFANHRISQITLSGTANVSGSFKQDGISAPTIKLRNNTNQYTPTVNSNGSFEFTNIPRGTYYLEITKIGYASFGKYIYLLNDVKNINAYLYAGDVTRDSVINSEDLAEMQDAINNSESPTGIYKLYDLNEDGVINNTDLSILQRNLGKATVE